MNPVHDSTRCAGRLRGRDRAMDGAASSTTFRGSAPLRARALLPGISPRTLAERLRAPSSRRDHPPPQLPERLPRVEYQLTEKGVAMLLIITAMRQFGHQWLECSVEVNDHCTCSVPRAQQALRVQQTVPAQQFALGVVEPRVSLLDGRPPRAPSRLPRASRGRTVAAARSSIFASSVCSLAELLFRPRSASSRAPASLSCSAWSHLLGAARTPSRSSARLRVARARAPRARDATVASRRRELAGPLAQ